ncbi:alpha/beta hydrolase [Ginsengibacter hankyongi]|uniref:Alpha/beta hydrolase n=2 Tax=Ginsengibacter hankyongi TaxID=2607284 RepID=A0A5J5IG52_9BACT|nr:alpha/beta hydrolase [Ginsengibacter hankyongi]
MLRVILNVSVLLLFTCGARAQDFIPLWPVGKMPDSKGLHLKDSIVNERAYQVGVPGMYAFFPSKDDNCGAAVVIYPGGGYSHIALNLGGFQLAKWFNTLGISAFVVKYRLPNSPDAVKSELAPLQDGQRALQIVRANAKTWNIQKNKIGAMGTSAGGHLAAWVGTAEEDITSLKDSIDENSFEPNFMILVSPVIDMGEFAHKGSRESLLGKNPSDELIKKYSPQNNVTDKAPPCFIADAFNDKTVQPINSLLFYQALLQHKISTSFHVFPQGGHAINVNNTPGSTSFWKELCEEWLKEMGFISFEKK